MQVNQEIPVYIPRKDSISYKVLSFLLRNQDEELTRDDIAIKFDANHASIDSLLSIAKSRGALVTSRNSSMELVWKIGDTKIFSLKSEEPEIKPSAKNPRNATRANVEIPCQPNENLEGMPFECKITKNGNPQKFSKNFDDARQNKIASYEKWFSTFDVNDTAAFGLKFFYEVARLAAKYGRKEGRVFCCKKRKEGYVEIIRLS